jgi:ADP-ribosylglycohydrolase
VESVTQRYFKASVKQMVAKSGGQDPMVACYIDSSFPALLHFAYKYADSMPETAILASANAGGENVARGSLLGAIMGAAYGVNAWPAWARDGLHNKVEISKEMDDFFGKQAPSQHPSNEDL